MLDATTIARPRWATADREVELTDAWQEVMDPEGTGEECFAILRANGDGGFRCWGVRVEDGTIPRWYDRAFLATNGLADLIDWAEEYEFEATGWGDRYDAHRERVEEGW